MKKVVTNCIYEDGAYRGSDGGKFDYHSRENGMDWPQIAHTMIGLKRLENIQFCMETVFKENIPGDFIETGVWRGGAVIFMRAVLKAYGITDRIVWAADSFEGLPKPNLGKYPADHEMNLYQYKELSISLEEVKKNFEKYALLDSQVKFLKGWFKDTLPIAPIKQLAVLRLDGDMYESTMDALVALYPKLSIGGFVIVDDYFIPACARAIHDYRYRNNIQDPIVPIDQWSVYWKCS